ncbi:heparan-alpha-glucosaminide N-acetyltransferase domain-containing protein [Brachybacterium paraconglomeratum]|uniref:heparan-alpha-glucosaminide N-acetyltransferase domain-containing protein n=1 Tax=Brachybacterium paraconglomeratum TaxID=173362 RepID=UPI0037C70114
MNSAATGSAATGSAATASAATGSAGTDRIRAARSGAPARRGPRERLAALVSPPRVNALDIARALAILGMIGAHVGDIPPFDPTWPASYLSIVHGNSSMLFAVLAGISIALVTGQRRIPGPAELPRLRASLLGRGIAIFLIGLVLEMMGTGVAVILTFYGVVYIAALPVIRLRPSRLLLLALPIALLGPVLVTLSEMLSLGSYGPGADLVLTGSYRFTSWAPLILLGMALGRMPLDRPGMAARIAAIGAGAAVLATAAGMALAALLGTLAPEVYGPEAESAASSAVVEEGAEEEDEPGLGWEGYGESLAAMDPAWELGESVISLTPHSGSTLEIFRSGGIALAVIGGLLLIARPLRWALLPLSAMGSMPLTAYSVHLVSLVVLAGPGGWIADNRVWVASAVVLLVACTAWSALKGRGPLERVTACAPRRAGQAVPAAAPGPAPRSAVR